MKNIMVGLLVFVIFVALGIPQSTAVSKSNSTLSLQESNLSTPPIALQKAHRVVFGFMDGEDRGENPFKQQRYLDDPWFWLRDESRKNNEVLDHLSKENLYTQEKTKHLNLLKDKLYAEHISHLKESDETPPYKHGKYYYYTRTVEGKAYKLHCRKTLNLKFGQEPNQDKYSPEEIILDENLIAAGHNYTKIRKVELSHDHDFLAYSVDFNGTGTYGIRILKLTTGEHMDDQLEGTSSIIEWGQDDKSIFYTTKNTAKRPNKAWKHIIGTSQDQDVCLVTEADSQFGLYISKSHDGNFLFFRSISKDTSEVSFINLHSETNEVVTIQNRKPGLKYSVQSLPNDRFIVLTDADEAINNRIMIASIGNLTKDNWREVIPYDSNRQIKSVQVFQNFIALEGRQDGLPQIWVIDANNQSEFGIDLSSMRRLGWPNELYKCKIDINKDYSTNYLRIKYSSLTLPPIWFHYNMSDGTFIFVEEITVLNFDPRNYTSKRMMAKANDGTLIPISLVHKKDLDIGNGDTPTILYGYGSYGYSMDPGFHQLMLPYLDRGMVFAIAHVRGGGEMGRQWYKLHGKYLNKRNTFSDFINCAEHLIETNLTNPSKLAIRGSSAGGLLVGAVLNMRPDLFKVAVADVPFVDVMNTMSDPSLPLTTIEWEEWGNPNEDKYFDYMLSYSPYDNVREQPYPNILITCGLNDPYVGYWEPVKWASKLKTKKTDQNEVLVKIRMDSGHHSSSDRYKKIKERIFEQSYVLHHLGLVDDDCKEN